MHRAVPVLLALLLAGCLGHEPGPIPVQPGAPDPALPPPPGATTPTQPAPTGVPVVALPRLQLEPGHGHVIVKVPAPWRLEQVLLTGPGIGPLGRHIPGGGDVVIDWLQPDTTYTLHAQVVAGDHAWPIAATFRTAGALAIAEHAPVRPGAQLSFGATSCTLGFLLRDARNETLYGLTAGHCVAGVGQVARVSGALPGGIDAWRIGTIVARGNPDVPDGDWALIQLDDGIRHLVTPSVNHWTGPTAVFDGQPAGDGTACHVGWGLVLGWASVTRTRCGDFQGYDAAFPGRSIVAFAGDVTHGDSGSPVVEHATGRAIGMIVRAAHGYNFSAIDLCYLIQELGHRGHPLALLTAGWETQEPVNQKMENVPLITPREPDACPGHVLEGWWPAPG